ncbi:unnamed protein product [Caenorhabditis sp. 36 PRJEB53466]|nr:unnamed protein product [Caenorhabditis sp. 36 PRJEB53466]
MSCFDDLIYLRGKPRQGRSDLVGVANRLGLPLKVLGVEAETRLLENENVILDAPGNAFVEDENSGQFLVISTSSDEKAVTGYSDYDDRSIGREIPKKIAPFVGRIARYDEFYAKSASIWAAVSALFLFQTANILEHEAKLNLADGIVTDPKMLPQKCSHRIISSIS